MKKSHKSQSGMSLLEVMIVLFVTTLLGGVLFKQINNIQQTANNEETKLDLFQEERDFLDQMSRDLHQSGYPNMHNFAPGQLASVSACSTLPDPTACDTHVAAGITKVDVDRLYFEGDVDGTGTVSEVWYQLSTTGVNCPCLRRSQITKSPAVPLPSSEGGGQGSPLFYTEIQNVQNGTSASPIFQAFHTDNSGVTLPVDFVNNASDIANINEIKVTITAQSKFVDPRTGVKPSVTMVSTIKLNNCSQATSGQTMSCQ